jgi:hypothetical protein
MVADALNSELGVENPHTIANERAGTDPGNGHIVDAIAEFLRHLSSGD